MTLVQTSTPVVRVENVSKRFVIHKDKSLKERLVNFGRSRRHREDFWALRDVNVEINSGTTVGLIGPNGSGKSTLLKMIGGILQPTTGQVELRGRLAALLELGAGFHPDLTGRENVYLNAAILGMSRQETDSRFDEIVDFSGIEKFIDTQVKFYSSGMYVRLAFAVAIHVDPDILLVDEVLAVGDEPFQRKCMERIERFQHEGRTIVLVTHSLDQVAQLCDRAIVLDHGKVLVDDVPRVALRALRLEFDATEKDDAERSAERAVSEGSYVPPQATVTAVELIDPKRKEKGGGVLRRPGDELRVHIEVNAHEELPAGWILGVRIDTPLGQNIWGTNSKMLGTPMGPLRGEKGFEFVLSDIPLGEGEYSVYGSVRLADGALVDRKDTGPILSIVGQGRSNGFITIPSKMVTLQ